MAGNEVRIMIKCGKGWAVYRYIVIPRYCFNTVKVYIYI